MKSASAPLLALLNSGEDYETADLWTLTLSGGQVVRWSGADKQLSWSGNDFLVGPVIARTRVAERRGVEVSTLTMKISANDDDLVNGVPLIEFIRKRGLDGANVRLERAHMPTWEDPVTGVVIRFAGKVTSVGPIEGGSATVQVSSWLILLNVNTPPNLYQTACLNTVYDTPCGLDPDDWDHTGTVTGVATQLVIPTSIMQPAGWFAQGQVILTTGPAAGVRRAVRSSTVGGVITLAQPLPVAPSVGNAITALPGCDLGRSTCLTKFNNLLRHRGQPFVPVPETAV